MGTSSTWTKKCTMMKSWALYHGAFEWPPTLEQKSTTTRSWTFHRHCPGDLQHLNRKKTQWWGSKLFTIMSMGLATLEQKNTWWARVVVALGTYNTWTKKTQWRGVELLIIVSLGPATLKQKKCMTMRSQAPCRCVLQWPATLEQKSMTRRSWGPHHYDP